MLATCSTVVDNDNSNSNSNISVSNNELIVVVYCQHLKWTWHCNHPYAAYSLDFPLAHSAYTDPLPFSYAAPLYQYLSMPLGAAVAAAAAAVTNCL